MVVKSRTREVPAASAYQRGMRSFLFGMVLAAAMVTTGPALAQQSIAQQRVDAAARVVARVTAQYSAGTATVDDVGTWLARWYAARKDAGARGAALLAAAREWSAKAHALETATRQRVQTGLATAADSDKALFYRLEADAEVARLRTP
jgi:hypothetical protein